MFKSNLSRGFTTGAAALLACATLLSGCASTAASSGSSSSSSPAPSSSASSPAKEVDLTFWDSMGGTNGQELQKLVGDFNTKYAGQIKVTAQYQGSYDDTLNKFKTAMVAKNGPDILQSYDLGTSYLVHSGFIDPVQTYADKDNWNTSQIDANIAAYYTVNGKLNSMPFNSSTPILYYNKDEFKAAGLTDADVPKTFADIEKLSPKLTKKDSSGKATQNAIGFYVYGWFLDQSLDKMGLPIFDNGNGRTKAPTKTLLGDNGGGLAFLKAYHSLITSGAMPSYSEDYNSGEPAFETGKLAMYVDSTSEVYGLLKAINGKFELGTAYYPTVNASDKGGVSVGGASLWMMKNSDDAVQQAKWTFIKYMVSPDVQAEWNAKTGYFPVNTGAYGTQTFKDNETKYPQFKTAIEQLHASSASSAGGLCSVYTQVRKIQETEIQKAVSNQESDDAAVKSMVSQINSAISEYNAANS